MSKIKRDATSRVTLMLNRFNLEILLGQQIVEAALKGLDRPTASSVLDQLIAEKLNSSQNSKIADRDDRKENS